MEGILSIVAIVGLLGLLAVVTEWAGKCPKCLSYDYWYKVEYSKDDHQPHLYFENLRAKCRRCGHVRDIETDTKLREQDNRSSYL